MGPDEYPKSRRTAVGYSNVTTSLSTFTFLDEVDEMPDTTTGSVVVVNATEIEERYSAPDPDELREFLVEQETERFFLRLRRREDRMLLRRREWTARDRRFQRSVRRGQKRGRRERRQQEETE